MSTRNHYPLHVPAIHGMIEVVLPEHNAAMPLEQLYGEQQTTG